MRIREIPGESFFQNLLSDPAFIYLIPCFIEPCYFVIESTLAESFETLTLYPAVLFVEPFAIVFLSSTIPVLEVLRLLALPLLHQINLMI